MHTEETTLSTCLKSLSLLKPSFPKTQPSSFVALTQPTVTENCKWKSSLVGVSPMETCSPSGQLQ